MKRTEDMAEREPLTEIPEGTEEIDRALQDMAENTPEMPADFHDRWMAAVREEAGKKKKIPWTRILSTAAVFVVISAVVINSRSKNKDQAAVQNELFDSAAVVESASPEPDMVSNEAVESVPEAAVPEAAASMKAAEPETAEADADYAAEAVFEAAGEAEDADFAAQAAEEPAGNMKAAGAAEPEPADADYAAEAVYGTVDEIGAAPEPAAAMAAAEAPEAMEAESAEEIPEADAELKAAGAMPATASAPTAAPTAMASPAPAEEIREAAAGDAETEESASEKEIPMGDFVEMLRKAFGKGMEEVMRIVKEFRDKVF